MLVSIHHDSTALSCVILCLIEEINRNISLSDKEKFLCVSLVIIRYHMSYLSSQDRVKFLLVNSILRRKYVLLSRSLKRQKPINDVCKYIIVSHQILLYIQPHTSKYMVPHRSGIIGNITYYADLVCPLFNQAATLH